MKLTEKQIKNFWKKVDIRGEEDCWEWSGAKARGYGQVSLNSKNQYAHRISAYLAGMSLDGLFVCHTCDTPVCVNPNHLFVGSALDNMRDMARKGRGSSLRGEKANGVKLSEAEVLKIRALYTSEGGTYKDLADLFGVSATHIRGLILRKVWKHI